MPAITSIASTVDSFSRESLSADARPLVNADIKVWDAQYFPSSRTFDEYREAICKVYMPWNVEFNSDGDFQARVEMAAIEQGWIVRHRCSPHVMARTSENIANSERECFYVMLILSGRSKCMQRGRSTVANPGDILVVDSAWPARVAMGPEPVHVLANTIPKFYLGAIKDADRRLGNVLLKQKRTPLSKCLMLMAERIISASYEELASLYVACLSLLPLEAGCLDCNQRDEAARDKVHYLLRAILRYIDKNIENSDLSPNQVAHQFGVSVRYVHKLFHECGMAPCSYITARRLDYVRKDLMSPSCRQQSICVVAFRWGFKDLSSFNRAFKSRFGCTPSYFRMNSQ